MTVESWITPEETPVLAEAATAMIEARLSRFSEGERSAFWASIRKCYNTPYNDPVRRPKTVIALAAAPVEIAIDADLAAALPLAAIAAAALPAAEAQAA